MADDGDRGHLSEREQSRSERAVPRTAWIGLLVFFIGCAFATVAIDALAGDRRLSLVTGSIAAPLVIIGLVLFFVRGRISDR